MRYIHRYLLLFVLPVILFCSVLSVRAEYSESSKRIYDDAGLFTAEEQEQIAEAIQDFQEETNMDCAVATTRDTGGKSSQDYADDLYEWEDIGTGSSHNGMLYLIDLDHGEIYISTEGEMLRHLTDARLDRILDHAYKDASEKDYAGSVLAVLQDAESFILDDISENQRFPFLALFIGMLAGAVTALGTFFTVRNSYHLTKETYRYPLSEKSRLQLTTSDDILINQFVTHRKIPRNPPSSSGRTSSGGHTTTHRSGSGRTHGGRGRKL